jgi:hypothetical protein
MQQQQKPTKLVSPTQQPTRMDIDDDGIDVQQMAENIVGKTPFDGYYKLVILEISAWAWRPNETSQGVMHEYSQNKSNMNRESK